MTFNIDWIENHYRILPEKMTALRELVNRPLTYTEKILYAHLSDDLKEYGRGSDYAEFNPDRVAMQDATAQMALLQFMLAGKNGRIESPYESSTHIYRKNIVFPSFR